MLLTIVEGSRLCKKDVGHQGQPCKYLWPPSAAGLPDPKPQPCGGQALVGAQALPPPAPGADAKVNRGSTQIFGGKLSSETLNAPPFPRETS